MEVEEKVRWVNEIHYRKFAVLFNLLLCLCILWLIMYLMLHGLTVTAVNLTTQVCFPLSSGTTGRLLYLRLRARRFGYWLGTAAQQPQTSCLHRCASVTKQYNLIGVLVEEQ